MVAEAASGGPARSAMPADELGSVDPPLATLLRRTRGSHRAASFPTVVCARPLPYSAPGRRQIARCAGRKGQPLAHQPVGARCGRRGPPGPAGGHGVTTLEGRSFSFPEEWSSTK